MQLECHKFNEVEMNIYKGVIEDISYNVEEAKKVENAKSKAMSNERRLITELFKDIKFEVEDISHM